jgi:hypothetical protein
MRWCVELASPEEGAEAKVNFALDRVRILLHVAYRRHASQLVINRHDAQGWGMEMVFALPPAGTLPASLFVSITRTAEDAVLLCWRGGEAVVPWLRFGDLAGCGTWLEGAAAWHVRGVDDAGAPVRLPWQDWRLHTARSGLPAGNQSLLARAAAPPLPPGASFLIRAKNEAPTIEACLRGVAGLADEIVFVDNDSDDATAAIAERLRAEYFELRTYRYPHRIPRAGAEHAAEVFGGGCNTLGHFYNWCLARAGCANIIKWDADYIALRDNLAEMIRLFDLRTRGDNFVLWFSGLEVYTDGERHWVDTRSAHSEFRVFSARHGHQWVNLPPWEELDQAALFRAQKLFFEKPVYLELFRLDEIEFRDRGLFSGDARDRERYGHIRAFRDTGILPAHFLPVDGLDDPRLAGLPLSARELDMARHFDRHFRAMPKLFLPEQAAGVGFDTLAQGDVMVFVLSCARNGARQDAIRETWGADLQRLGIPWLFVVGRPGQASHIVGDTLYLDVPDSYEFLASKVLAAMEFSLRRLNVDYVFKIDDDCVLDAERFLACTWRDADFTGGGLAGGAESLIDWHVGKCRNSQLDHAVHFREPGTFWVGGQFGYFLSRAARAALVAAAPVLRASLYEDYAVTKVLAASGMRPHIPFGDMVSLKWADGQWQGRADVAVVADTPDAATQRAVHTTIAARQVRAPAVQASFDWMDFESVRRVLASEPPESMAATAPPVRLPRRRAKISAPQQDFVNPSLVKALSGGPR